MSSAFAALFAVFIQAQFLFGSVHILGRSVISGFANSALQRN